jgi:hypothetical protein
MGFEAFIVKSSVYWDIPPHSPLKVSRRFGGTVRLHLQGWRVSQARNEHEAGKKSRSACFMLISCLAYSSTLKMGRNIPPKRLLTFSYGVIFQKIELVINLVSQCQFQFATPKISRVFFRNRSLLPWKPVTISKKLGFKCLLIQHFLDLYASFGKNSSRQLRPHIFCLWAILFTCQNIHLKYFYLCHPFHPWANSFAKIKSANKA